jgi:hypothetical protein
MQCLHVLKRRPARGKEPADLRIQFRETSQSAQSRILRAVSGNWNGGTSVSFRLQADPFEGQVKFSSVIEETRFNGPQGAG